MMAKYFEVIGNYVIKYYFKLPDYIVKFSGTGYFIDWDNTDRF
jgi:hypothetical protein